MAYLFKHSDADAPDDVPAGQWALTSSGDLIIRCPECKRERWVPHEVNHNGEVRPSIVCAGRSIDLGNPCNFHEFVILQDWNYGYRSKKSA